MKFDKPRKLLKSAAVNLFARVAGGLFGLIQVVLIAREFGISTVTDAYMIAVWIPMIFWGMGETILIYSLVPYLVTIQEEKGREAEIKTASDIFFWFVIVLLGISVLVFLAAPFLSYIVAPGFSEETRSLAASLIRQLAPVIFVGGIGAFISCLFYASHSFAIPAIASLLPDLGVISLLLFATDRWGIRAPAGGFLAGVLIQTIILVTALFLVLKKPLMLRYSTIDEFRNVISLIGPRAGGVTINRFNIGVDRFFASFIGSGSVSALVYSYRIVQIPLGLSIAAFGKTLMPVLTREVISRGTESLRNLIPRCISFAGFGLAPLVLFFLFYSETIIRILYQRGVFDPESTAIAAKVLFCYSLGILFNAFSVILQGAFYAMRDTYTPLKVGITSLVLNIILDIILINILGLPGIALASVLVALCSFIFLSYIFKKKVGALRKDGILRSFKKILPALFVLGWLAWGTDKWVLSYMALETRKIQILLIISIFTVSWGIYLVLCKLFKVEEYLYISRFLGKRLGRQT